MLQSPENWMLQNIQRSAAKHFHRHHASFGVWLWLVWFYTNYNYVSTTNKVAVMKVHVCIRDTNESGNRREGGRTEHLNTIFLQTHWWPSFWPILQHCSTLVFSSFNFCIKTSINLGHPKKTSNVKTQTMATINNAAKQSVYYTFTILRSKNGPVLPSTWCKKNQPDPPSMCL